MRYESLSKLQFITSVFIFIFTALSAFDCLEHWFEYTVTNATVLAGEMYLKNASNNCFIFMLVLSILEIVLIQGNRFWMQLINTFLSIVRVFVTLRIPVLKIVGGLIYGTIGGLGREIFVITPIGYIVFILSWLIFILDIRLAFLKGRKSRAA